MYCVGDLSHKTVPAEVYRCFWPQLSMKPENNRTTDFAGNEVAQKLKSVLEPFVKSGKAQFSLGAT